jgi:MFS family permease
MSFSLSGNTALAPFRERNFRLYFAGQMVSVVGTWLQFVAEGWIVFQLTHSPAWLGIVAGAAAGPGVLLTLKGGQVADRYPRRRILLITQTLSMLLAGFLALLASGWWIKLEAWHVAALAAMLGAVNAFSGPAFQSFLPTLVPRENMGNAIALNSMLWNGARVMGPLAAGALIHVFGAPGCFGLNSLSYLPVIAALLLMRVDETRDPHAVRPDPWEGLRFVWRTPIALRILALFAVTASFGWLFQTLLPAIATERFHRGADAVGQLTAAAGVGALVAAVVTAAVGAGDMRRNLIYGGAFVYALGLIVFSHVREFPLALATLVVVGCGLIICGVNINARLQEEVPDELRGRVMAVFSLIWMGFQPLGGLIGGAVAQWGGTALAIQTGAYVCLAASIALFSWSNLERRGTHMRLPISNYR